MKILNGKKILIVEDCRCIRHFFSTILSGYGCLIYEAEDGNEALRIIKHTNVDAILTDINMPHMDGLTLLKTIALSFPERQIPAVIVSTATDEYMHLFIQLGVHEFLHKPCSSEELLNAILKLFREKS